MSEALDANGRTPRHRLLIGALGNWLRTDRVRKTIPVLLRAAAAVALDENANEDRMAAIAAEVLSSRVTRRQMAIERAKEKGEPRIDTMRALMAWREELLRA